MGGFSNAPRCPASLTFRDSPALARQESDGYPVRPAACYSDADCPLPPPLPPFEFVGPDKLPDVGPPPRTPLPLPAPRTHPDTHIQDKPGVLLSKEKEKRE